MDVIISSGEFSAAIKEKGAELHSVKNKEGLEFMWQAGKAWERHAPVLFPIVGRLKNDTYRYKDKEYKMSQHGFARDRNFSLVTKTDSSCSFELQADAETKEVYPFDFKLRLIYHISGNKLQCSYEVENAGNTEMFFSIGAHPGFRCPLRNNENFSDYSLLFEQYTLLQTALEGGLRSTDNKVVPMEGKKVPLSSNLFDNDALVFENKQINSMALASEKSGHRITVNCRNWPYFGVWSKKGNTEFVCLEPWHGIADHVESGGDLEKKDGIISLGPGKVFKASYELIFA